MVLCPPLKKLLVQFEFHGTSDAAHLWGRFLPEKNVSWVTSLGFHHHARAQPIIVASSAARMCLCMRERYRVMGYGWLISSPRGSVGPGVLWTRAACFHAAIHFCSQFAAAAKKAKGPMAVRGKRRRHAHLVSSALHRSRLFTSSSVCDGIAVSRRISNSRIENSFHVMCVRSQDGEHFAGFSLQI